MTKMNTVVVVDQGFEVDPFTSEKALALVFRRDLTRNGTTTREENRCCIQCNAINVGSLEAASLLMLLKKLAGVKCYIKVEAVQTSAPKVNTSTHSHKSRNNRAYHVGTGGECRLVVLMHGVKWSKREV